VDNPETIIGAVVILLVALGAILRGMAWWLNASQQAERDARQQLEIELRRDIEHERGENQKLRSRIKELEVSTQQSATAQRGYEQDLLDMRSQIGTLLAEMSSLQETVKQLRSELDQEKNENERLRDECGRQRDIINTLTERNRALEIKTATYRDALALVRGESTETKAADAAPEPGEGAGTQEGD